MSLQVLTTPEADAQIREIENWWRRNRAASPNLFADELAATIHVLGHAPHIGRLYRQSPVPDTRRVLLKGTRYHVYYVPRSDQVIVLSVWHAQRGVGPPLRVS